MTRQEEAERFAKKAPPLNQVERDAINDLFPTYIFRRSKTDEIWTSCCRRHETLPDVARSSAEYYALTAPHQREPRNSY